MKFEKTVTVQHEATHLLADMGVRYWEDADIDGRPDDDDSPRMPLVKGGRWCLLINLDTGIIADWPKGTTAATHYKVCDDGNYSLLADGAVVAEKSGYVPDMLCSRGWNGDYVILEIDGEGKIEGWDADLSYFESAE